MSVESVQQEVMGAILSYLEDTKDHVSAKTWTPGTDYSLGDTVVSKSPQFTNFVFKGITAGTSGSTEPSWPSIVDETVTDGGVTWVSQEAVHHLYTYIEELDTTELEEYLLKRLNHPPTLIESAVQEALNYIKAWQRDNRIRSMSREDYFSDYDRSVENDILYLRDLKELQRQYIRGTTPQQKSY